MNIDPKTLGVFSALPLPMLSPTNSSTALHNQDLRQQAEEVGVAPFLEAAWDIEGTNSSIAASSYGFSPTKQLDQIQIIIGTVADLVDNMEDLEPEFAQVIEDNFWDLF